VSYSTQNQFFARAYRTGTDHWSTIPFTRRVHELVDLLPKGSIILDLGTGRGRLLFDLAALGFRAIGLEINPDLIARGNNEIKEKNLDKDLRFFQGSALEIPMADQSFDGLVDIGLLHHISPVDYKKYVSEASRVLKQDGYFFLVVLSKNTPHYLAWHPSLDEESDFEFEGVQYHFFSDEELRTMFEKDFEIKELAHDMPYGPTDAIFSVMILKKK